MMADILFVAAEPRECKPFLCHWTEVSDVHLPVHWARAGKWKGRYCVAIANGAGVVRAGLAASAQSAHTVCSIGFCGALEGSLRVGDIFVASEVRNGAERWKVFPSHAPEQAVTGPLQTAGKIIGSQEEKRSLRAMGNFAVDMEASAVARASEEMGAAFYCIRAVSDCANETFVNDFNACLLSDGRFDIARLISGALNSPRRMAELVRLARRTSLAAKNLGDYLASCEF